MTIDARRRLPDGFDELAAHNLVSFKSYQEALDAWALQEQIGHYGSTPDADAGKR